MELPGREPPTPPDWIWHNEPRNGMDISDWRKKIDELDRELVQLLNARARCSVEIGKIKRRNGLPIQEPNREQEVLQHAFDANEGPLPDPAIQRMFERILEEGKVLQKRLFEGQERK